MIHGSISLGIGAKTLSAPISWHLFQHSWHKPSSPNCACRMHSRVAERTPAHAPLPCCCPRRRCPAAVGRLRLAAHRNLLVHNRNVWNNLVTQLASALIRRHAINQNTFYLMVFGQLTLSHRSNVNPGASFEWRPQRWANPVVCNFTFLGQSLTFQVKSN